MTNHIFHRDGKWWAFEGELPVKPNVNPIQYVDPNYHPEIYDRKHPYIKMEEYNKAISDLMDSAVEVVNYELIRPSLLGLCKIEHNRVKIYQWPGSYEKKYTDVLEDGNIVGMYEVAHLVLPEGDFKPVYMDQDTVPTERMNHQGNKEENMKTEPIAIFNPKDINSIEYAFKLRDSLEEVRYEVERAKQLFPSMFINQHEAIAVIREEYLELEQECFKNQKKYDLESQRKEAKQLAAMAIRLMIELT